VDFEQGLRAEEDHPVLLSHFAKYRSLMPSLALIGHLIDGVDDRTTGRVSRAARARAVAWCEYLEGHARRLYATVTDMAERPDEIRLNFTRALGQTARAG
jgi:hypothetical protein